MPSSASPLTSLLFTSLASYFVPPLLVNNALKLAYSILPRSVLTPSPTHPVIVQNAIVLLYACYTVLSAYVQLPIHYFDLLRVPYPSMSGNDRGSTSLTASWKDTVLRPRWLSLVKAYHPDKLGGSEEAQAYFRQLQRANEVLKSDSLRLAYERFGSDTVDSLSPSFMGTERELFVRGVTSQVGWYIVSVVIFVGVPTLAKVLLARRNTNQTFWRLTTLLLLLSTELSLLSTSTGHLHMIPVFGELTTFQLVTILRHTWLAFNILLSQMPLLQSSIPPKPHEQLLSNLEPMMGLLRMRSDISGHTVDGLLRQELGEPVDGRGASVDRVVRHVLSQTM